LIPTAIRASLSWFRRKVPRGAGKGKGPGGGFGSVAEGEVSRAGRGSPCRPPPGKRRPVGWRSPRLDGSALWCQAHSPLRGRGQGRQSASPRGRAGACPAAFGLVPDMGSGSRSHGLEMGPGSPNLRLGTGGCRHPYRGSASSQTPPSGRNVMIITGAGALPATFRNRNRASSVARMITASCIAKLAPMQIRGPSPKGR